MAHTPVDSHLVAMREELSAEELITRAQNAPRNYDQRWSPEILQLVERWAVLNGTHADYLHHWLPAMVFHAMKETRILAWEGFDGDGWPEPPNRTCIVFSESGGGKSNGMAFYVRTLARKYVLEGADDSLTSCTLEGLLRFLVEHQGEAMLVMDEARRFMITLEGEYSKGKSSGRETFMEIDGAKCVKQARVGGGSGGGESKSPKKGEQTEKGPKLQAAMLEVTAHMTAIAGTHPHIGRGWFKAEEADTDGLLPKISVVFSKAEPQPLLSKQSLIKKSRERMSGPQLHYMLPGITYLCSEVAKRQMTHADTGGGEFPRSPSPTFGSMTSLGEEGDDDSLEEGEVSEGGTPADKEEEEAPPQLIKKEAEYARIRLDNEAYEGLQGYVGRCNAEVVKIAGLAGNGLQQSNHSKAKGLAVKMSGMNWAFESVFALFNEHEQLADYRGDLVGLQRLLQPHVQTLLDEADARGRASAKAVEAKAVEAVEAAEEAAAANPSPAAAEAVAQAAEELADAEGAVAGWMPQHITASHMAAGIATAEALVGQQLAVINNVSRVNGTLPAAATGGGGANGATNTGGVAGAGVGVGVGAAKEALPKVVTLKEFELKVGGPWTAEFLASLLIHAPKSEEGLVSLNHIANKVSPKPGMGYGTASAKSAAKGTLKDGVDLLIHQNIASELVTETVPKAKEGEAQLGKVGTKKYFLRLCNLEAEHLAPLPSGQRVLATMRVNAALKPYRLTIVEYSKLFKTLIDFSTYSSNEAVTYKTEAVLAAGSLDLLSLSDDADAADAATNAADPNQPAAEMGAEAASIVQVLNTEVEAALGSAFQPSANQENCPPPPVVGGKRAQPTDGVPLLPPPATKRTGDEGSSSQGSFA